MEFFTEIAPALTGIFEVISDTIKWAVGEPIVLVGLAGSIAMFGLGLFGSAKGSVRM